MVAACHNIQLLITEIAIMLILLCGALQQYIFVVGTVAISLWNYSIQLLITEIVIMLILLRGGLFKFDDISLLWVLLPSYFRTSALQQYII
jgi:hypothetical protein